MRVSHPFVFEETPMRNELIEAILKNQAAFGLELSSGDIERLADYFEIVQEYNPLLHLVAPCSPEEFAIRHVLESLALLEYLPKSTAFADVGTGAGLPSIPCLLVRDDVSGVLIESKEKKAGYLLEAIERLGLSKRTSVFGRQFTEVDISGCSAVTARAIDRFSERLPRLIKWAGKRRMFLFGGKNLADALLENKISFKEKLLPLSDQRFLFRI
jgi:16S rRNA (guanine(527)-N(7))-methyltransferase RsmG